MVSGYSGGGGEEETSLVRGLVMSIHIGDGKASHRAGAIVISCGISCV